MRTQMDSDHPVSDPNPVPTDRPDLSIRNFDPLAVLLKQTLRLTPVKFGVAILLLNLGIDLGFAWYYDILFSESKFPGLLQDLLAMTVDFVAQPLFAGLYLWTTTGATQLFEQLDQADVFTDKGAVLNVVDEYRPIFRKPAAFIVITILAIAFTAFMMKGYLDQLTWKSTGGYIDLQPQMSFLRMPFWFLNSYSLLFGMFNVYVTIQALRQLFRRQMEKRAIRLVPLHPDGCGGLGSLSKYTLHIAWGIAVIGLVLSASTLFDLRVGRLLSDYLLVVSIFAYAVFAPLYFFWPLGTAHEAMRQAKDDEILLLARRFDATYAGLKADLDGDKKVRSEDMSRLRNIKELYQIAGEFPVWPFDVKSLRRFFAIVTAPLLPAVFSFLLEYLTLLLSPR